MEPSFLDALFGDLPALGDLLVVFNPFFAVLEAILNLILFFTGGG